MKKIKQLSVLVFIGIVSISAILYVDGSPGGKTNSPGDGANCSQCHGGTAVTAVNDWITSTIPETGYEAGNTYTITASASHATSIKMGFEVTCEDTKNNKVGNLTITNTTDTKIINNNSVTHTADGTLAGSKSRNWSFDWTAPVAGTGNVTFYGAFNASNSNGGSRGDEIFTSYLTIIEKGSTSIDQQKKNDADINVFPNPTSEKLYFDFFAEKNATANIKIFNTNGKIIQNQQVKAIAGKNSQTMDIKNINVGNYIIEITVNNKVFKKQFIIK